MTTTAALASLLMAAPCSAALIGVDRLATVYDTILSARFEGVERELTQTCPPAPMEACASLGVAALWWQILIAPENRAMDGRFNERAAAAIRGNEAWTKREPNRGEAWFYLAASYGPLVQWRVLRGERLAAAREGSKVKDALERALQLDPSIEDAYFGIGLYHYYADVAPAAAKLLRWLLFLPGGDRVKGLEEMLQARQHGVLLKGEADYQLHQIYLWYERKPQRALELLQQLDDQHSANPLFLRRIAEIQDQHLHDRTASVQSWRRLIDRARAGRVYDAAQSETRARAALKRLDPS